ncbi:MAG: hypothetical protein O7D86_14935 [Proteobacteria bacterium]|nr:hypothetical protein [Pseudomonadota bacterium]
MVDSTKKPDESLSNADRGNLINRIDELEELLAKKNAETQNANLPRLRVGTDGIPVLVQTVAEEGITPGDVQTLNTLNKDDQIINDIIKKVDEEISKDLEELVFILKNSIIDEVKTRLLKELHNNEDNNNVKGKS